eukprot:m.93149 g.93149  ORF g.93149 m.93149 type:complete len:93 (-) comp16529_c0_seq1:2834-3112(-)
MYEVLYEVLCEVLYEAMYAVLYEAMYEVRFEARILQRFKPLPKTASAGNCFDKHYVHPAVSSMHAVVLGCRCHTQCDVIPEPCCRRRRGRCR